MNYTSTISLQSLLYIHALIEESDLTSMARSSRSQRVPASREEDEDVELDRRNLRYGDELSFYRALARHTIGDPTYYESILHAVQTHYWRVLADEENPYHAEYKKFEQLEFWPTTKFFGALSCPDFWLCPCGWQIGSPSILRVVTDALNIKIVLWKEDNTFLEDGPVEFPEYHVKFPNNIRNKGTNCCKALTPANDGRNLIQYLENERCRLETEPDENALKIRRLVWWRDPVEDREDDASSDSHSSSDAGSDGLYWGPQKKEENTNTARRDYQCYNEYAPDSKGPPDLVDNPDSFHVFTAVVRCPTQIRPALRLLDEALKRAPGQELPLSQGSGKTRPLKRYVALDAEFKEVCLENKALEEIEKLGNCSDRDERMASSLEYLCSILTVAVDRQLVFSFYLLDMLQNPTEITVEEVSYFFEKLIFNKEYLKLWFNFQNDISVLDATIAHMYQGTPRERFQEQEWRTKMKHWVRPTWKIHSDWYKKHRPRQLCFPRFADNADSCELHNNEPYPPEIRVNAHGLSCPCRATGNVDITTVILFLCRQLGYRGRSDDRECIKPLWHQAGYGCNYGAFLRSTMGTDRLQEVLQYLKNAPSRAQLGADGYGHMIRQSIKDWYQSLGPDMETDGDKMGYNIGDVAGIALLMRFLTSTDDRMLFVTTLANYMDCGDRDIEPVEYYPQQVAKLEPPPPDSPNAYIYLNDYPKSWKRTMIGNDSYPKVRDFTVMKVGDLFRGRVDDDRRLLSYFEHDTRAQVARECFKQAKIFYGGAGPTFPQVTKVALDAARAKIFDPLDYSFPRWFTHEAAEPRRAVHGRLPIIRAGVTPYEDLLTKIKDIKKDNPDAEIQLPTTRGEGKSEWYGLPRHIGRTSGKLSFELPETREPLSPIKPPHLDPMDAKVQSRLSAAARKSREDIRVLREDWELQRSIDVMGGKATQTIFHDIFDPRGRNYRRDWHLTYDGKAWRSPPPPGTAPGEDFPPPPYATPDKELSDEEEWGSIDPSGTAPYEEGSDEEGWSTVPVDEASGGVPSNLWGWENPVPPSDNLDEEPSNTQVPESPTSSCTTPDEELSDEEDPVPFRGKHARSKGNGSSESNFPDEQSPDSRPSKRVRLGF